MEYKIKLDKTLEKGLDIILERYSKIYEGIKTKEDVVNKIVQNHCEGAITEVYELKKKEVTIEEKAKAIE